MSLVCELIIDAYGCQADLSDPKSLEQAARTAVNSQGAQVVEVAHHKFQPHGLTLCLILKESHFIVSTWPEHQLAIVNIFLCNPKMNTRAVWTEFAKALKPASVKFHDVGHELSRAPIKQSA